MMFRKSMMALATIATIAAAAFASSPADAKKWHGHGHHGHGHGWRSGLGITIGAPLLTTSCMQYQWVETRRGWRRVLVDVCG